jgi:hypothetical protein
MFSEHKVFSLEFYIPLQGTILNSISYGFIKFNKQIEDGILFNRGFIVIETRIRII